jgi:hypothetical protein
MDPASVGQPCVNEGHRIVETPTNRGCQTLCQPAYVAFAPKPNAGQLEPGTAIHEDLICTVDEDVGHPRLVQQLFQWTRADAVPAQRLDGVEYG